MDYLTLLRVRDDIRRVLADAQNMSRTLILELKLIEDLINQIKQTKGDQNDKQSEERKSYLHDVSKIYNRS